MKVSILLDCCFESLSFGDNELRSGISIQYLIDQDLLQPYFCNNYAIVFRVTE